MNLKNKFKIETKKDIFFKSVTQTARKKTTKYSQTFFLAASGLVFPASLLVPSHVEKNRGKPLGRTRVSSWYIRWLQAEFRGP